MMSRPGFAFLSARAPRLVACLVGLWLEVSPAVLDYDGWAADSDRTVGPFVAAISFVALWELGRPLRWLTLPLGAWPVAAPLLLWYGELVPSVNSIVCGLVIVAMAPLDGRVSGSFTPEEGGSPFEVTDRPDELEGTRVSHYPRAQS